MAGGLSNMWRGSRRTLLSATGAVLLIAAWESARLLLPGSVQGLVTFPSELAAYVPRLVVSPQDRDLVVTAAQRSSASLGLGLAISVVIGGVLGIACGWYRPLGQVIDRYMMAFYLTPIIVLVPLLVVVFGIDLATPTVMVVANALPQLYFVVCGAVISADSGLLKMARMFGAGNLQQVLTVVVPSIVPAIVTGVRQAIGRALVAVIVVEFFVGRGGIGGLILDAMSKGLVNLAFVGIILLGLVNVVLVIGVRALERRVESWKLA